MSAQASPWIKRRWLIVLGVGVAVSLLVLWPHGAFAAPANPPRPPWNPGPPWAPLDPKAPEMHMISDLFWIMLVLSAVIFFGVVAAIVISVVRFSAGPNAEPGPQIYGHRTVEITWTAIPFLILIVAFAITAKYIHDINTASASNGKVLNIIARGHQWWWEFDYPAQRVVTADEFNVPAGVQLHFHIESADVIHSFWIPQLQRQVDANPGQDNAVYVVMPNPGTYAGACYEYCGTAHAWMKFKVVVQSPHDFALWIKHEQSSAATPTTSLEALGRKVFMSNTCIQCHTIDGVPGAGGTVGPNLTHIGSRWTIGAGALPVSVKTAEMWIRSPTSYKPGVLMPGYPLLSQKDVHALATYLVSLK